MPLTLAAMLLSGTTKCVNPDAPQLAHQAPLYATDSRVGVIFKKLSDGSLEIINTNSARFDEFVCSPIDLVAIAQKEIIDLSFKCEKWKK